MSYEGYNLKLYEALTYMEYIYHNMVTGMVLIVLLFSHSNVPHKVGIPTDGQCIHVVALHLHTHGMISSSHRFSTGGAFTLSSISNHVICCLYFKLVRSFT